MTNQSVSHKNLSAGKRKRATAPHTKLLGTDMDSTIGLFWSYFVPAMDKISPILAAKLGVPQEEFERELGRVMHKRGTHEWPWVLEETKYRREWKGTPQSFRTEISEPFWNTLDEMRAKYLRPFDDVLETIDALNAKGVKIAIVSDAPFYMALTRACDHGIDGKIEALYALDAPLPDVSEFIDPFDMQLGLERIAALEARSHKFKIVRKLPKNFEKPNPGGLAMAMKDFGVKPSETLFIGDSAKKDGGAAEACGVRFIWARYGIYLPPAYVDLVDRRFTPTGEAPTNGHGITYRPSILPPMVEKAASFEAVLNHLGKERRPHRKTILNPSARPQGTEEVGH
ncbi:MAG TPA: HAD family hydrolase [Candidatus Obscuribacter sp.]|nr:HAD family hydrolase [Candidatus Obscuribacter sp.]HNM48126.1 HAD family hydrolase [Candidatus Obscuribacter sp.]